MKRMPKKKNWAVNTYQNAKSENETYAREE